MERQRATSIIVKHCTSSLFCSAYLMVLLLLTVHFFQSRISTCLQLSQLLQITLFFNWWLIYLCEELLSALISVLLSVTFTQLYVCLAVCTHLNFRVLRMCCQHEYGLFSWLIISLLPMPIFVVIPSILRCQYVIVWQQTGKWLQMRIRRQGGLE